MSWAAIAYERIMNDKKSQLFPPGRSQIRNSVVDNIQYEYINIHWNGIIVESIGGVFYKED